jgi:hypothetical protein
MQYLFTVGEEVLNAIEQCCRPCDRPVVERVQSIVQLDSS